MSRVVNTIKHQHGAVTIIVAISIFVLVGMIGLAIDLGRMFVIKTELQNAADACALAASKELDGQANSITRADDAGVLVGTRNFINFQDQDENAPITSASLTYSATLSPNNAYDRPPAIDPTAAKYAMCTVSRPDIGVLFMGVMGFGAQTVRAYAVATLAPGQTTCAIPLGVCTPTPGAAPEDEPWGLEKGQWYSGRFGAGSGGTGSYNWIDFAVTGGGANELRDLLAGAGQCSLPEVDTCVGEQGVIGSAADAWNTRFGLYKAGYNSTDNPPDRVGLAYTQSGVGSATETTWPNAEPQNAYAGTYDNDPPVGTVIDNYDTAFNATLPPAYQASNPAGINGINAYTILTPTQHATGQLRRVALAPVVDCSLFSDATPKCGPQAVPLLGYACVLMLNPIKGPDDVVLEYLGQPGESGVPCGSYGLGGGSGPLVPVLVQ